METNAKLSSSQQITCKTDIVYRQRVQHKEDTSIKSYQSIKKDVEVEPVDRKKI